MKVGMDDEVVVVMEEDRRKEAIEELVRGREFANQLREIIINNDVEAAAAATQHLVRKVLRSFANTLFLFRKYHPTHHQYSLLLKSDDDEEEEEHHSHLQDTHYSFKSSIASPSPPPPTTTLKDRRGFYKRKRSIETWSKVWGSERDHDDEHEWRKYGQKRIQNAKYERNYYRCSQKYDQGCQATKHVQMVREKPTPSYMVTYYGHHTCRNSPDADHHHILLLQDHHDYSSSSPSSNKSIFLSFDNSIPNPPNNPFFSSSSAAAAMNIAIKQRNDNNNNNNMKKKEGDEVVPSSSSTTTTTRRTGLDEWSARWLQLLESELEYNNCWPWDIDDAVMMSSSPSGV